MNRMQQANIENAEKSVDKVLKNFWKEINTKLNNYVTDLQSAYHNYSLRNYSIPIKSDPIEFDSDSNQTEISPDSYRTEISSNSYRTEISTYSYPYFRKKTLSKRDTQPNGVLQ